MSTAMKFTSKTGINESKLVGNNEETNQSKTGLPTRSCFHRSVALFCIHFIHDDFLLIARSLFSF